MSKIAFLIAAVTLTALTGFLLLTDQEFSFDFSVNQFEAFNVRYNKTYSSMADRALRHQIFQANYDLIIAHNRNPSVTYTLELNQFADLTFEEFEAYYLTEIHGADSSKTHCQSPTKPRVVRPDNIDWVSRGKVQRAKNQGACGSCWAFSAIGAVESALAIKAGDSSPLDLSEQELVDCSTGYGNKGCRGGLMNSAFDYILDRNINLAHDYPYKERDGNCMTDDIGQGKFEISGCIRADRSIDGLVDAIATTPVSVAFSVQDDFRFYKGGVYNPKSCCGRINHGVLAVGFDSKGGSEGVPYFLVKNSWGGDWGDNGFFRIAFGTGRGTCSIAGNGYNYYPTV
jgi:C1A family cysteine protease